MFQSIIMGYMLDRLKEPSTWGGFALMLSQQFHVNFTQDFTGALTSLGVALGAFLMVVMKEGIVVKGASK